MRRLNDEAKLPGSQSSPLQRLGGLLGRESLAWAILAVLLLLTLGLWRFSAAANDANALSRFEYRAEKLRGTLIDRMQNYEQVLQGAVGLFAASEGVSRQEWHDYVQALELDKKLPGIVGTGFVLMLPAAQRAEHEAAVRAEGFSDYAIWPPGERQMMGPVLYIEPYAGPNQRVLGFDMLSDPVRWAAIERARDSGEPTLSGNVTLVSDQQAHGLPGSLMYLAVYRKHMPLDTLMARRNALLGFAFIPFHTVELMRSIFRNTSPDGEVEVYDGEPVTGKLIYASEQMPRSARHVIDKDVLIGGHRWTLRVRSSRDFEALTRSSAPQWYLGAGLALDLLLFAMLYMHVRHNRRMLAVAAELQGSRDRFRILFEDTRQPIMLLEDGRFIAANKAALRMLAMDSLEQIVGRTPLDISPEFQPDGRRTAQAAAEDARIALEQGSNEFEAVHVRATGEPFTARVLLTRIRQDHKDLLHAVCSDITAQKRAERELADYRQQLEQRVVERTTELAAAAEALRSAYTEQQTLFEMAPVGISLIRDRVIQRCNRKLEEICGYGPGELLGVNAASLYAQGNEAIPAALAAYEHTYQGETASFESQWVRKDGTTFWVRLTSRALERHDPAKGIIGIIQDITQERQAREALNQARQAAETANRAKTAFLSTMSHELRTPMNAIMGMAHILQETRLDPHQQSCLKELSVASRHLLALIDDILDYVRIDAGTEGAERRDFELASLLGTVVGRIRDKATAKGLKLGLEVDADVPAVLVGDAMRIAQVLHKLCDNAVKFTEAGEVGVDVRLVERHGDAVLLRFEVRDTGIGMDQEEQARLFQTFQQGDDALTRKYGGTGLGLAIARRLIELMGGEIGVESEKGKGSRFWFQLRTVIGQTVQPGGRQASAQGAMARVSAGPAAQVAAAVPPADAPFDVQLWHALRQRLIRLLQDDDAESVQLFEDHAALLRAALGERFGAVAQSMRSFDFAAALAGIQAAD